MKKTITILSLLLIALISLIGCTNIEGLHIGNIVANTENTRLKITFSLFDDGNFAAKDGTVLINIVNDGNETVYSASKAILKDEFVVDTVAYASSSKPTLSYEMEIPLVDIKNSTYSSGKVYISFSNDLQSTKTRGASTYSLPVYSNAELIKMTQEAFLKVAKPVNQSVVNGNLKATSVRGGFFTPAVNSMYGCYGYGCTNQPKEYYVVELQIENLGDKVEQFSTSNVVLKDKDGNQYDVTSDYNVLPNQLSLSYASIFPGVKKTGMYAFENVPKDVELQLLFEAGYTPEGTPILYKLSAN